jgi:hypothetical protein
MSRAAQNQLQQIQLQALPLNQQLQRGTSNIEAIAQNLPSDLTPAQKAAAVAQQTSGAAATFGQGRQRSRDTLARTGSLAGEQETNANLTRGQAEQNATNMQKLQSYFANVPFQFGQAKANIFGQGMQPTESALGANTQLQSSLIPQAYAPGLFSQVLSGLASGAGGAATKMAMGGA